MYYLSYFNGKEMVEDSCPVINEEFVLKGKIERIQRVEFYKQYKSKGLEICAIIWGLFKL